VCACCLTPNQQFSSYIKIFIVRTSNILMRWWSTLYKTFTLSWIFIVLKHRNNSPQVNMSLHSDTISRIWVNRSLLLLLKALYLVKKHQIPISKSVAWPDRGPNPWSTALEASNLTITPLKRFVRNRQVFWFIQY